MKRILSVLLVLALVVGFSLVPAVPASAAPLTPVSATTDNSTAGATANYTIAFTTATSGNITTIVMAFAAEFDVSGATLGTVSGIGAGSIGVSGDNVTYTVSSPQVVADNVSVSIGLSNIVNPTASGSHNITITTKDDGGGEIDSGIASVTINPAAVATLTMIVEPSNAATGVAITPPVQVKAEDEFTNVIPSQNITASLEAGTGMLSGTLTQVTNTSGLAIFANLSIDLRGEDKVLGFTANGVTVNSTSPFAIYPVYNSTTGYLTIQDAIDGAFAGDTLVAFPGTYSENITIYTPLRLVSAAGSANTTISANVTGFAVDIISANVTLGGVGHGFTITNSDTSGSGIKLDGSSCRIDSNKIDNNYNGIQIAGSENHVRRNTITGNSNYGVYFISDAIGEGWNEVYYNDITGNDYGAFATPKTGESHWMQWAGFNFWGDESGPGGAGPGTGNNKVNEYVWYNPWLNASHSTILASGIADISMGIPLEVGWNTLSTPLPLSPDGESNQWGDIYISSSLASANCSIVYTYDPVAQVFPVIPNDSTDVVLKPLEALFLKVSSPAIVTIKISTYMSPMPTKDLVGGWNFIGASMLMTARELDMRDVLITVDQTPEGHVGYDMIVSPPLASQPSWVYVRGQEARTEGFEWEKMWMGRGYWIYMENADQMAGFGSTPITAHVWD